MHLDRGLDLLQCGKSFSHSADRGRSRFPFPRAGGAFKQSGNFPQLFTKFSFRRHRNLAALREGAASSTAQLQFTASHGLFQAGR
jgi:hypothetical protein